ncbi:cysteine-type deubiquitinase [Malassezia pachydermatis]|uniref:ubiquitinyl hydrolase 1 n=1 Tax=Malassezia pachydermatis TaxID=77020 RepID=A0A0M8MU56_9BASI|nr:uch-domain-containing protein [Malassezia pachydermatis]KOS13661.1 uch-domain-containing protein [Malassezia pachydermatis]
MSESLSASTDPDPPTPSPLDRFKRARTSSFDTDRSSPDVESASSTFGALTHRVAAFGDESDASSPSVISPHSSKMPSPRPSDESVDSLIGDALHLDDERLSPTALVREVEAWRVSRPRVGDTWYIVPTAWYAAWKAKPSAAGPIDLRPLVQDASGSLRADLLEGQDYELLPRAAWDALASRHTVQGTPLARAVVPGAADGHTRIELFPPSIELARIGASAATPRSTLPRVTLSSSATLRTLKAHVRALGVCAHVDEDLRFLRVPVSLRGVALTNDGSLPIPSLLALNPAPEIVQGNDALTLASQDLDAPQMLLAVDIRKDGRWGWGEAVSTGPMTRSRTQARAGSAGKPRGLRGLANLGNTCFMNSALQCLSNTEELQQYFLRGAQYKELNTDNPLGMGGALAAAYGRLVQSLWNGSQGAVIPREFKTALARFAPQFTGYAQQDTQELLAFLLDGLHEDLNRIVKKPYIESPDWEGGSEADMVRFAQKQWDMYKARNDSVIVDLFQGQYRSTLVCPVCAKVSIKFDPFMYLTLPIPNTRQWRGRVYVVPHEAHRPLVQVDVQLPATATIAHLRDHVAALVDVDPARLLVGEAWSHHVYRWLDQYEPVRDIGTGDYMYLWDTGEPWTMPKALKPRTSRFALFSRAERTIADIEKTYAPPTIGESVSLPVYSCKEDGAGRFGSYRRTLGEPFGLPFFVTIPRSKLHDTTFIYDAVLTQYTRFSTEASREALLAKWAHVRATAPPDAATQGEAEATPASHATAAYPFALRFAAPSADEALHRGDDATDQTSELLTTRLARDPIATWPALYNGGALYAMWETAVADALFQPVLANQSWGPVEEKQDAAFQRGTAMLAEHRRQSPRLRLEDCLDEFTKAEQLGEDDLWYCPSCKEFRQATKKFDLWKVPDILVVHLKRFSAGRVSRDKLDNLIDFPLEALDLSDRVVGTRIMKEQGLAPSPAETHISDTITLKHDVHDDEVEADAPIYDLYAVDNHFGGLGGGHYTAFAKNPMDGHWYNYDDSSVRPVSDPQAVKSSAAYLLFYRRRTSRPLGGKSRDLMDSLPHVQTSSTPTLSAPTHAQDEDPMYSSSSEEDEEAIAAPPVALL